MKPLLANKDAEMFYRHLNNATVYFEYGSGGSTFQASIRKNLKKIYSVESDIEWLNKLKKKIDIVNIRYIYNEMDTKPNTWGNPGKNATDMQKIKYSDRIKELSVEEQKNIDMVFIDGRFRVACCLKCYDVVNDDCYILFDDFLDRPEYHIVLHYYDIVEKTTNNRMVVLKKKANKKIPKDIIEKYELNKD